MKLTPEEMNALTEESTNPTDKSNQTVRKVLDLTKVVPSKSKADAKKTGRKRNVADIREDAVRDNDVYSKLLVEDKVTESNKIWEDLSGGLELKTTGTPEDALQDLMGNRKEMKSDIPEGYRKLSIHESAHVNSDKMALMSQATGIPEDEMVLFKSIEDNDLGEFYGVSSVLRRSKEEQEEYASIKEERDTVVDMEDWLDDDDDDCVYEYDDEKYSDTDTDCYVSNVSSIGEDIEKRLELLSEALDSLSASVADLDDTDEEEDNTSELKERPDLENSILAMLASLDEGVSLHEVLGQLVEITEEALAFDIENASDSREELFLKLIGEELEELKEDMGNAFSPVETQEIKEYRVSSSNPVNDRDIEKSVVSDYLAGIPTNTITERYNISTGTLYTFLNRNNVPKRDLGGQSKIAIKMARILDNPTILSELISDYNESKTVAYIFDKYNIHKNGLYYILDVTGTPRRGNKKKK